MGRGRSKAGGARLASAGITPGKPNDATEWYVSGEGMWINQYLRGRGDFGELTDNEKQLLKELDIATDGKLPDKTLYRSVDASAIFGDLNDNDMDNVKQAILYGQESFGRGAYAEGIRRRTTQIINNTVGSTQTEKGFMSTTSDLSIAEDFQGFTGSNNPVVMRIKTGGKARGVNLSGYDKNAPDMPQKERLLARNTKYRVDNIYANGNRNIIIDVTLVN